MLGSPASQRSVASSDRGSFNPSRTPSPRTNQGDADPGTLSLGSKQTAIPYWESPIPLSDYPSLSTKHPIAPEEIPDENDKRRRIYQPPGSSPNPVRYAPLGAARARQDAPTSATTLKRPVRVPPPLLVEDEESDEDPGHHECHDDEDKDDEGTNDAEIGERNRQKFAARYPRQPTAQAALPEPPAERAGDPADDGHVGGSEGGEASMAVDEQGRAPEPEPEPEPEREREREPEHIWAENVRRAAAELNDGTAPRPTELLTLLQKYALIKPTTFTMFGPPGHTGAFGIAADDRMDLATSYYVARYQRYPPPRLYLNETLPRGTPMRLYFDVDFPSEATLDAFLTVSGLPDEAAFLTALLEATDKCIETGAFFPRDEAEETRMFFRLVSKRRGKRGKYHIHYPHAIVDAPYAKYLAQDAGRRFMASLPGGGAAYMGLPAPEPTGSHAGAEAESPAAPATWDATAKLFDTGVYTSGLRVLGSCKRDVTDQGYALLSEDFQEIDLPSFAQFEATLVSVNRGDPLQARVAEALEADSGGVAPGGDNYGEDTFIQYDGTAIRLRNTDDSRAELALRAIDYLRREKRKPEHAFHAHEGDFVPRRITTKSADEKKVGKKSPPLKSVIVDLHDVYCIYKGGNHKRAREGRACVYICFSGRKCSIRCLDESCKTKAGSKWISVAVCGVNIWDLVGPATPPLPAPIAPRPAPSARLLMEESDADNEADEEADEDHAAGAGDDDDPVLPPAVDFGTPAPATPPAAPARARAGPAARPHSAPPPPPGNAAEEGAGALLVIDSAEGTAVVDAARYVVRKALSDAARKAKANATKQALNDAVALVTQSAFYVKKTKVNGNVLYTIQDQHGACVEMRQRTQTHAVVRHTRIAEVEVALRSADARAIWGGDWSDEVLLLSTRAQQEALQMVSDYANCSPTKVTVERMDLEPGFKGTVAKVHNKEQCPFCETETRRDWTSTAPGLQMTCPDCGKSMFRKAIPIPDTYPALRMSLTQINISNLTVINQTVESGRAQSAEQIVGQFLGDGITIDPSRGAEWNTRLLKACGGTHASVAAFYACNNDLESPAGCPYVYSIGTQRWAKFSTRWYYRTGVKTTPFALIRGRDALEPFYKALAAYDSADPETRKARQEQIRRVMTDMEDDRFQKAVVSQLEKELEVTPEAFDDLLDTNPDILQFDDGSYDLRTDTFFPGGRREWFQSKSVGYDYAEVTRVTPEQDKEVERIAAEIVPDDEQRRYTQKALGLCVSGHLNHRAHFCIGSGGNGKSILFGGTGSALGEYAIVIDAAIFTDQLANLEAPSPQLMRIKGTRLVLITEWNKKTLEVARFKNYVGGEKISGRNLNGNPVVFKVMAKFFVACNNEIQFEGSDGGVVRRFCQLNFPVRFVDELDPVEEAAAVKGGKKYLRQRDLTLERRFEEELRPAMMKWLLAGYRLYKAEGLNPPKAVVEATAQGLDANNSVLRFLEGTCEIGVGGFVEGATLHGLYVARRRDKMSPVEFGRQMGALRKEGRALYGKVTSEKKGGKTVYVGLRLKGPEARLQDETTTSTGARPAEAERDEAAAPTGTGTQEVDVANAVEMEVDAL